MSTLPAANRKRMSACSRIALIPALLAAGCSRPLVPRDVATRDAAATADNLATPAGQTVPNAAIPGASVRRDYRAR